MPIVGVNIKEVSAKKEEEITGGVKVNNASNLLSVKEQDLPALKTKGLTIGFEFKSDYISDETKKEVATIVVRGELLFVGENQKEILKGWEKDKKLPEDLNIQALNTVLRRGLIKALDLSEELQLPPPIALPFASKKQEDSKYIG